jgi:hypothetical protein
MKPADFWTRQAILFLKVSPSAGYVSVSNRMRKLSEAAKNKKPVVSILAYSIKVLSV